MNWLRRVALLPLVAILLGIGTPPTFAAADNTAVILNTKDDTYAWRQAFKITRSNGDDVLESNGAAAVSSCERCRTAAVAFQVVIGTGTGSTVAPENVAIALNEQCLSCATYAGAYQLTITPHTQVRFTEAGNEAIDGIRAELQTLVASASFDNSPEEIQAFDAQVGALFDRLVAVVSRELIRVGGGGVSTDVDTASGL
jgi:hypothetical protein